MVRAAWAACEWYGQAPGTLDPLKEVEAQGKAVAYGFTTGERATIELNGGDWDANHKRLALEQGLRRSAGLGTPAPAPALDPDAPTNGPDPADPADPEDPASDPAPAPPAARRA